ncbi:MAG: DNA repair protein RadA [Clostridia bacterium]|nr:DNA repair protein RadA [Clostridia bacterium]
MAKNQTIFVCSSCGNESAKWLGKCPACNEWNTYYEEKVIKEKSTGNKFLAKAETVKLKEVETNKYERYKTGYGELDRVLGGGLVQGSLVLIGGEPGIGKSTLILQICDKVQVNGPILYVSGEESGSQIKMRADRLKIDNENIYFLGETSMQLIDETIEKIKPGLVIIDSIQTIYSDDITAAPGSVSQVREVTSKIMMTCKKQNITTIIIGHVTKDGNIAGPRVLEHMVDTVLYIEGERYFSYRVLRGVKNRFGSTNEVGLFEMREEGMVEIDNPSDIMISDRNGNPSGSVIVATLEGTRTMLIEVQALVTPTAFGMARRTGIGVEFNRLVLLLAVLEKKAYLPLSNQDAYVNVVSGIKLDEPAADLAIALAVASSFKNVSISKDLVAIGEVGLTGEIRSVSSIEKRVKEAERMGFSQCMIPESSKKQLKYKGNIEVIGVNNIKEAIQLALKC